MQHKEVYDFVGYKGNMILVEMLQFYVLPWVVRVVFSIHVKSRVKKQTISKSCVVNISGKRYYSWDFT